MLDAPLREGGKEIMPPTIRASRTSRREVHDVLGRPGRRDTKLRESRDREHKQSKNKASDGSLGTLNNIMTRNTAQRGNRERPCAIGHAKKLGVPPVCEVFRERPRTSVEGRHRTERRTSDGLGSKDAPPNPASSRCTICHERAPGFKPIDLARPMEVRKRPVGSLGALSITSAQCDRASRDQRPDLSSRCPKSPPTMRC